MSQNFLQLNTDKTEVIIFGNKEQRSRVATLLRTNGLKAKDAVRNLGIIIDSETVSFNNHVKSVTKSAFFIQSDLIKRIQAFTSSRIDYGNALLTGIPQKTIKQL